MAYTAEQIKSAVEQSLARGFSMDQVYQGALANFGVSRAEVDAALQKPTLSNPLYSKVQKFISNNQPGYNPEMAYTPVGQFQENGRTITVQPDGTYDSAIELGNGLISAQVYDSSGNLLKDYVFNRNEQSYLSPIVNALKAAAIGTVLGPAGIGLSAPAAAAGGAGLGNLSSGGDLKSALTSAVLAGSSAYGLGSLFGTPVDDFLTADVAQLAAQGIPEEQIAQILTQEGLSSNVINAALDAQFGTSAPGSAKTVSEPVVPSGAEQVTVTGQPDSSLGALSTLSPALDAFVPSVETLPSLEVTGQTLKPDLSVPDTVAATLPAIVGGDVQQVGVQGSKIPAEPTAPTSAAIGNIIAGLQPSVPSATEQVQVTGTKEVTPNITIPDLSAALPAIPEAVKGTLTEATKPVERKTDSLFNPSDVLKLLTLLAGGSAVSGATSGGNVGSIPTSNPLNYDDNYFSQIQKYYNAYMPQYPRDVATPLQQWYENKYGA